MKIFKNLIVLLALTIAIFSCETKEPKLLKQDVDQSEIPELSVKNGVLVFRDWQVVFNMLDEFENTDIEYLDEWEKRLGFTSLRTVYDCFTIEEQKFVKEYDALYNENKDLVDEEKILKQYNSILDSYKPSIVLVDDKENKMQYYDINLYHKVYSPIVNEYGIVSVNGDIYRFTKKDERKLIDKDWSKLSELMNDDSPFIKLTEDYYNNLKRIEPDDETDPDDPSDPNDPDGCSSYSYSYPTINQWEKEKIGFSIGDNGKAIVSFKFLQRNYTRRDYDCNYTSYVTSQLYYEIVTYRWRFIIGNIKELSTADVEYDYRINSSSIIDGSYYHGAAFEHTKTLYTSTYGSNYPTVTDPNLKVTVNVYADLDPDFVVYIP